LQKYSSSAGIETSLRPDEHAVLRANANQGDEPQSPAKTLQITSANFGMQ
jgi:hypothetical protein